MKRFLMAGLIAALCVPAAVRAQYNYGTTGLLHAPTADMQRDKTFMAGGAYIDKYSTTKYFQSPEVGNTWNYFVNITFFPWLEVGYVCTLIHADNGSGYFPEEVWGKFCNQDRSFHVKLRLWKEGWWRSWTPQIVVGFNDALTHESNGGGGLTTGTDDGGSSNKLTRYFIAASKHFGFANVGELGAHVTLLFGNAKYDVKYTRPVAGVNFQFAVKDEGFAAKALNGLNLMAEYFPIRYYGEDGLQTCSVNVGASYRIWRDHINLWCEEFDMSHFSFGLALKVHLK